MSGNNHKMKGLLKGLRYISQIFDEEKEQDIKIGFPTDVKHVAHIGWDGPSVDSPSWMKDFKAPGACQSAPLSGTGGGGGDPRDNPESKWVSDDPNRRSTRSEGEPARDRDIPDVPRSRRHASSENVVAESLGKEGSTKSSRQSRKSKGSDGSKSSRQGQGQGQGQGQDPSAAPESPSKKMPDIPKKSRRKKSKEEGGSTRSSRSSKPNNGSTTTSYTSSDHNGYEFGSNSNKELSSSFVNEEGKASS